MTHPPRFLQTILAAPQEDSPRLQYANWLEGCGNPLGEFIRLQCALARMPQRDYERRAQELLAEHRDQWSRALEEHVGWLSFHRGFIEEISPTDRQLIRHATQLFDASPVLDIHLQRDGKRLEALPDLPDLHHTFFLDLSAQELGDAGAARLADALMLSHVHGLNLGSNFLGDEGLIALADSMFLGELRELYLSDNLITDESVRQLVLSPIVEQLDLLDVRYTQIGPDGIGILRHILGDKVLA
jgi:uncharacterized protein (TIGR02996 family)